jgi:RNA polymerase sigma factor (sigma-70 family)
LRLDNERLSAIWRIESPKVIASTMRVVRDLGTAEEVVQDAFVAALAQWPEEGIPRNPGAWLTAVAKRRAIDRLRRDAAFERKQQIVLRDAETAASDPGFDMAEEAIEDDLLRLVFIACHPMLAREGRVALTLRLLGGLTTAEIARAFLVPEPTIAQRIVRAKRTLAQARIPFEVPVGAERRERLASVLEVIYLIFNEGYAATSGDDVLRPELCNDAVRLGRVLAELMPLESEVHGLVALMEIQSSRARARVDAGGAPVLLADQDRARWDGVLISRGLRALERARALDAVAGPYVLQAAIAGCHAVAVSFDRTDWAQIAGYYDALAQLQPNAVVRLNRAVAAGMAYGPQTGLELAAELNDEPSLQTYYLLPAVRAEFLGRLGRYSEACVEFERAAALTANERARSMLLERATRCRLA